MYVFLDNFFFLFHTSWITFVLIGWIWRRTRRLHLFIITLTALSWFVLGLFYGFGYCLFTDWHWRVKKALGETNLPNSYVNYYLDRITGRNWDPYLTGVMVILIGLAVLCISLAMNWRDWNSGGWRLKQDHRGL
jgi:hypothetical protein